MIKKRDRLASKWKKSNTFGIYSTLSSALQDYLFLLLKSFMHGRENEKFLAIRNIL